MTASSRHSRKEIIKPRCAYKGVCQDKRIDIELKMDFENESAWRPRTTNNLFRVALDEGRTCVCVCVCCTLEKTVMRIKFEKIDFQEYN